MSGGEGITVVHYFKKRTCSTGFSMVMIEGLVGEEDLFNQPPRVCRKQKAIAGAKSSQTFGGQIYNVNVA